MGKQGEASIGVWLVLLPLTSAGLTGPQTQARLHHQPVTRVLPSASFCRGPQQRCASQ